jgi:hypothetical protein
MKANIGNADKVIRLIVGLFVVIYVGYILNSWWGLLGIIPIFTVFTSRCLLYPLFGINTCRKRDSA